MTTHGPSQGGRGVFVGFRHSAFGIRGGAPLAFHLRSFRSDSEARSQKLKGWVSAIGIRQSVWSAFGVHFVELPRLWSES